MNYSFTLLLGIKVLSLIFYALKYDVQHSTLQNISVTTNGLTIITSWNVLRIPPLSCFTNPITKRFPCLLPNPITLTSNLLSRLMGFLIELIMVLWLLQRLIWELASHYFLQWILPLVFQKTKVGKRICSPLLGLQWTEKIIILEMQMYFEDLQAN